MSPDYFRHLGCNSKYFEKRQVGSIFKVTQLKDLRWMVKTIRPTVNVPSYLDGYRRGWNDVGLIGPTFKDVKGV